MVPGMKEGFVRGMTYHESCVGCYLHTSRPLYENEMRLSEVMTLARSVNDITADNVCYLN